MTLDEARQQFYQEMAELFAPADGQQVFWTIMRNFRKEDAARLAGHFGRLALGEYRNELRQAKKDAFLAGFAATRKGTAEDAWEDSKVRFFHDYPPRVNHDGCRGCDLATCANPDHAARWAR